MFRKVALRLSRRKIYNVNDDGEIMENHHGTGPKLSRILNLFDLTLLGVGSTLGVGIYVLAGSVSKDIAGPAVCLSFLVAAAASAISAACYAEFGARVPRAGSAYVYSYVTVGELIAFIIGWNLILEYMIGTASVARAVSSNFDGLGNHSMSEALKFSTPISLPFLAPYADWLSLIVTLCMTGILSVGVKSSSMFTNIFTFLNLSVVIFVITVGASHAKYHNWNINITELADGVGGRGGFTPFGFSGIMAGAAKCFFAFVGFDSIAAAGEEAKNAKRSIPLSILLTLLIVLMAYIGVSTVLTLMVPYYLQDKETPLVSAFQQLGITWAAWIVIVGSICGLTASLVGAMMPMPRIVYAMAKDGLLFRCLATVHPRFKTPFSATLVTGVLAAIFAMVTELDALVDMMSIGTLLAYTLVAISILVLRYEKESCKGDAISSECVALPWQREPTEASSRKSKVAISIYCGWVVVFCALALWAEQTVHYVWPVVLMVLTGVLMLCSVAYLNSLPKSSERVYFMVPLVPFVPALSIMINIYLMFKLSPVTWVRFFVWMFFGLLVYGCYGLKHSTLQSQSTSGLYDHYDDHYDDQDEDLSPLVAREDESAE